MQKDQNPTQTMRDESEVHRDVWTTARFEHCPTCSNFRLWFSAVHLADSLSLDFFVVHFESELLSTWLWHQSSAGSASSLTSEERSSVLLNNRWPTLEVKERMKQNRISRPEGLRGFFFFFLFWLCKWFCLSVCSILESHAFFNADAYLLITSVKAEKETAGPLYPFFAIGHLFVLVCGNRNIPALLC